MIILGIDPGLSGALAFYDAAGSLEIFDMPLIGSGPKGRNEVDENTIVDLIEKYADIISYAVLEKVNPSPSQDAAHRTMGATAAFSFGAGWGLIRGVLAANKIPRSYAYPQIWKRALGVPAAKDGAVAIASRTFPKCAEQFRGPRGGLKDGRAEAALIAYYGARLLERRAT